MKRMIACLLLILFLVTISPRSSSAEGDLGYQGTHILTYSTMGRLAEAYQKQSGVAITVLGGGCSDGVVAVTTDRAEMGGLCCPLKEGDGKDILPHAVARDIKVAVVNFINPLKGLTTQQLRDIHQGKITNWKELGWIDRPIAVIYRRHCLDREEPVRTFLGLDDELKKLASKAIVVRTDMALIDYVGKFPAAIGVTSDVFVKNRDDMNRLDLDGVSPSAAHVESGRYPFAAPMYIVTRGEPEPETGRFLTFVLSPAGQAIVRENLAGAP